MTHSVSKSISLAAVSAFAALAAAAAPALAQQKTAEDYRREAEAFEAEADRLLGRAPAAQGPAPQAAQRPATPVQRAAPPPPPPPQPAAANGLPPCKVGMKVPKISPLNYPGQILAEDRAKGRYQVRGSDGLVDWVESYSLRFSCVGAVAQPINLDYYIGNWDMFVGPTPNNVVINGKAYIEVGPGAKAPPIQVRKDGTYTWRIDSRTIVNGNWRPMADKELKYGTKGPAILLMKGEDGKDWEMYQHGSSLDGRDQSYVERMDMGLSYMATRSK